MSEHLLAVADQVFGEQHGVRCFAFTEQVEQRLLAFDLRKLAEVTVTPQQVEGVVDQPVLSACC